MTSLNKKSFFLQFLFYFSIALILLGLIQGIFGTLRLYNASEESYEKLAPEKIYTLSETTKNIPKQTLPEEEKSATAYYVAGEKNSIQEILQGSPPEKNITIEQEKENVVSTKKEKTKKIPTSPVQISITPEENSEPKGYKETILTVVTGKYFRDTLWKFPIIIDTERVEPR